ncbi:MAG TPA: glutathione S-transferase family protein [Candidatus Binatia bacterium]|nr:glutathione S-transferase family protein [Candidatus Binatia bacterium]
MIKLYDFPRSPYCQKVRLVLAEKDLSYEKKFIDLTKNEQKVADFLRLNPYGKVPVLIDEDEVIYDSTIINEYLEDEYPHPPLMPEQSSERARVRMFEDFADNSFTAQAGLLVAELRKPAEQADQERVQRYRADLLRVLEFLERHLESKEYIAGTFSLADLAFAPRLLILPSLGVEIPLRLKNVLAWSERLLQRPSVKQLQQELAAL